MSRPGPLHLLRPFTQWRIKPHTVDRAERYVRVIRQQGHDRFFTLTSRRPTRRDELLDGGSVYFVGNRRTLFRMPLLGIDRDERGYWIRMRPELIRVERKLVGRVRGWRYLEAADAPADLPHTPTGEPRAARIAADKAFEEAILA